MNAQNESERRVIIDDLITRYLADEIDRATLTEWVTVHRLAGDWPPMTQSGRLLMLAAHHLFMFERGDWPEDTLRTALALHQEQADSSGYREGGPMFDAQWIALLQAGHIPPGAAYTQGMSQVEMDAEFARRARGREG